MQEAFQKLDPEKQKQILDAVLLEFAEQGYANASTNKMVEKAKISKGLLFYYFKNKEGLFRTAFEYSLNYIVAHYVTQLDFSEPDFITRFTKATEAKLRAYLQNPLPFAFLASIHIHKDGLELAPELHARLDRIYKENLSKFYANLDHSLFRPDLEIQQVLNLVRWTLDGWSNEVLSSLQGQDLLERDWDLYAAEFSELLKVLRKVLYKEGDHGDS